MFQCSAPMTSAAVAAMLNHRNKVFYSCLLCFLADWSEASCVRYAINASVACWDSEI